MKNITQKILAGSILIAATIHGFAAKAAGPGPQPQPWIVIGSGVAYSNGGVLLPQNVTGGNKGVGTINVSGGYYVNGSLIAGLTAIPSHNLICNLTGASAIPTGCSWTAFADVAISGSDGRFPVRASGSWTAGQAGTGLAFSGASLNLQPASLSTIGGVQAVNAVASQWIRSISTSGIPALSQPAFTDISGTIANGQVSGAYTGITGVGTLNGLTVTSSFTATGLVKNTDLVSPTITINSTSCTLGSSCSISATAASITVATTSVLGGASGSILYDNAGVLGEKAVTGSGNVVLATSPTIASPTFSGTVAGAGTIPNSVLVNSATTVNGQTCTLGSSCTITAVAASIAVGTTGVTGGSNGFILYNNAGTLDNKGTTGTGNVVQATSATLNSPTLVTPALGVATATSINKVTITAPTTSATLTIADGKTLTASNTLTFTGTDGTSFAFPGSSDTVAGIAAAQTLTNKVINCANNTCTVRAASDITGQLPLANGGTNANLTASNGGIFYSTASAGAILAGTANASRPLLSGANTAPSWGAFSLPGSVTSGGVPYFSSTSAMGSSGVLAANQIVLGGGAGSPPSTLGSLGTTTTVLHGNASGAPTFGAVSLTADVSGVLPIANGGTNNGSISTSNGGIVYSTASGFDVLPATATAGLCVLSQSNLPPVWGSCSGAAAVSSVSNVDGSITVSPTTGAVVVSLAANSVVKSLNALVNAVTITAGTGIATVTPSGQNIPIAIDKATSSNLRAGTADKVLTSDNVYDSEATITFSTTQTFDFNNFINASLTLTNNISSLTCTGMKAGQSGIITLIQDNTGGRTMASAWCSQFRWTNGTRGILSTAGNAIDALFYTCRSSSICYVSLGKGQAN